MDTSPTTGQGVVSRFQPINELELLMADVESFLDDWLRRVEQIQAVSTTPDEQLRKRMRELELDKSQWEAKRIRETRDIHEKAEELTKAWLRLEDEQRRFLQVRDARAHGNRIAAADSQPRESVADTESAPNHQPSPTRHSAPATPAASATPEEPSTRRPSPLQGQRAGASAVRQFEQLRREIQSSRHQHRRV
jgi:hypothetical protein